MDRNRPVYVSLGKRIPFAKSFGAYAGVDAHDLAGTALSALIDAARLRGQEVGDVACSFMMKSGLDWNFGRDVVQSAGLSPMTPAYDLARACGGGLEASLQIALKIKFGLMDSGIAMGVETNSDLIASFSRETSHKLLALNKAGSLGERLSLLAKFGLKDFKPHFAGATEKRTGLSMGEHCEKMVKEWGIGRVEQDEVALASQKHAAAAWESGFYDDLVVPFGKTAKDTFVRPDTSMEKLAKLKPAFDFSGQGTLTAGNSSPLSDGAATVLLGTREWLSARNLPIRAEFVDAEISGLDYVAGQGLLMAPAKAVANLLKRNGLGFKDIAQFEIHEAFAGQVLCTLKAWESAEYCRDVLGLDAPMGPVPRERMNLKGGSVALGHPFGATGARIVGTLAKSLSSEASGAWGLISICTAGGMGIAALLRSP